MNLLHHRLLELRAADVLAMLGGQDDRFDSGRLAVHVTHRDLALRVRPEPVEGAGAPYLGMAAHQPVGKGDRGGEKGVGLACRVPEHHPLVARPQVLVAGLVHPHRDVGGLAAERDEHRAGLAVEAVAGVVVPDRAHPVAHQPLIVELGVRPDLARQHHHAGLDQGLAGDPARRIPGERGIEHGVGDLVRHLVGVSLGYGLRGQDLGAGHR